MPATSTSSYCLSPLRYPGGKSRAAPTLMRYIPDGIQIVCSPFFGGGSFELSLASRGIRVYGYDLYEPLVHFWQSLLTRPSDLADAVAAHYPLSKEAFYSVQRALPEITDPLSSAAVFFVLNRSSFSGSPAAGMSPGATRFTPHSIARVRNFAVKNVSVDTLDFEQSIALHPTDLLYLDPPYIDIQSPLYGASGRLQRHFDHERLARLLKQRGGLWLLSYNDTLAMREMYAGFQIVEMDLYYSMSCKKKGHEVLVLSDELFALLKEERRRGQQMTLFDEVA